MNKISLWAGSMLACGMMSVSCTNDSGSDSAASVSKTEVVSSYSNLVLTNYQDALAKAELMKTAIDAFVAAPTEAGFLAAKEAWLASRLPYGQTEAFRFYDGPIDAEGGPEGQLNAWPMDEVYLDYVVGQPNSGIINETSIEITKSRIANLNEGGEDDVLGLGANFDAEKSISSGYHAIEFLLWGQDFNATGPGERSWQDYLTDENATAPNGDRRGQYLQLSTELLVDDLSSLVNSWTVDNSENYRNKDFASLSDDEALKAIITAIGILAKGELAGERIDVALSTTEQEDEHSCFSDNTYTDVYANALGIQNVYLGNYGDSYTGKSISDMVAATNPSLDGEMKQLLSDILTTTQGLPLTFDQVIATQDSEGWAKLNEIVIKLQTVGDRLVDVASELGLGTISVELPE